MRVLPTLLLAYVVLGIQSGLASFIAVKGAAPNLMLSVVIFVSLFAPREMGLIAVYVLGLMQDVLSQEPLGVHPLVYAAVAYAVRLTQPALHRGHWLTLVILSAAGAALHATVLWLVGLRMPPGASMEELMTGALYTLVLTPVLLRAWMAMRKLLTYPQTPRMSA